MITIIVSNTSTPPVSVSLCYTLHMQMKINFQRFWLLIFVLAAGIVLAACQNHDNENRQQPTLISVPSESTETAQVTTTPTRIKETRTPTVTPQSTQTTSIQPITTQEPLTGSVLNQDQLDRLAAAAAAYISPDNASADATVKAMNYAAGTSALLTRRLLSIAILQDAGLLSPYLPLNAFWLASPRPETNQSIYKEAFPMERYEWKRDFTPMAEIDYAVDPMLPGDFIYTFGGNYEHMFTISRVDEGGRAYTVQNVAQGYLNNDPDDTSFVIIETLLYDPAVPGIGMVYEWANDSNWKLGLTGTQGYLRIRPIFPIEDPSTEQQALAARLDSVISATGGKWNILIETLAGETIYARRPDECIQTASTIKVAIGMLTFEFLEEFSEGTFEEKLQRGPIYNIMENDRSYEQLLWAMLVLSEEYATDILYENIHKSPMNQTAILEAWGLTNTSLTQRQSTARDMNILLRSLYAGTSLNESARQYLLNLLAEYSENDDLRLGRMNELSKEKLLPYNKRGSLLNPLLIVADSGIAIHNDQVYLLQFYAYYDPINPASYKALETAIGEMGIIFGTWLLEQNAPPPYNGEN